MDLTKIWVFLQQHRRESANVIAGVCLFLSGLLIGRSMTPYSQAQPIVFEDRECTTCSSSGGSLTELQELADEGVALRQGSDVVQAVAGAQTGTYVASVNSDLYHHSTCSSAGRIKEENKVWFTTAEEAESAGYAPSACTKEKLP